MKAALMSANLIGNRAACIRRIPGARRRSKVLDIRDFLSAQPAGFGRSSPHGRNRRGGSDLEPGSAWVAGTPAGFASFCDPVLHEGAWRDRIRLHRAGGGPPRRAEPCCPSEALQTIDYHQSQH